MPILSETFDLIRLPPPHQRLGEVNFNIVPDANLTYESEEDAERSSDSEDDDIQTDDGDENVAAGEEDGEAEDEDMEEVGMDTGPRQDRQVDEDYDD